MTIGVDPGGRHTGIVLRHSDQLVRWMLIRRATPLDAYLEEVVAAVVEMYAYAPTVGIGGPILVAVEDLNDPNPHMGVTAVRGIIDTAQVIGALSVTLPIVRIPPGRHGSAPLAAYPTALRGARELVGKGKLRHVRSAWDVAGTVRSMEMLTGKLASHSNSFVKSPDPQGRNPA